MDNYTQQEIDRIKQDADYQKQQIDQQTADEIRRVTEQKAQEEADRIRQHGENEANQIGS